MGKLEAVIEEVFETAPAGSKTRKRARVELKALRRLRECEKHEAVREGYEWGRGRKGCG